MLKKIRFSAHCSLLPATAHKIASLTVTIGNTIFGVFLEDRLVDYKLVIRDVVGKLASRIGKTKAIPICPCLFHLYNAQELLMDGKTIAYNVGKDMLK